jgi:hypothetical protein
VRVDVTCTKCGERRRLDVGSPAGGQSLEDYLHVVRERLAHRPSFECFGGHFETRPPVPTFWRVDWASIGE